MNLQAKAITIGILRALAILVGIVLLIWVLTKIKALFLFIGIAAVLSLIGRPVVSFLKKRLKFGNTLSAFLALILITLFFGVLIRIFFPVIIEQSKNISNIDFNLVKSDLNELSIQAADYVGVEKIDLFEAIKRTDYVQNFNVELIPSFVDIFFKTIGDLLVGVLSVLFISFFLLRDENFLGNTIAAFTRKERQAKFLRVFAQTKELLTRYFLGLLLQIMILTLFYSLLMLFFDIENAIAVAVICALLNIVPYLGPVLGAVLMALIVISNNLGADFSTELLPILGWVLLGYSISQLFDNLITQPVVFGKSVKSHPLEIFIVILSGGFIFGVVGMILAVPTYTALKVIAKEFLSEYKIVQYLTRNM